MFSWQCFSPTKYYSVASRGICCQFSTVLDTAIYLKVIKLLYFLIRSQILNVLLFTKRICKIFYFFREFYSFRSKTVITSLIKVLSQNICQDMSLVFLQSENSDNCQCELLTFPIGSRWCLSRSWLRNTRC